MKTNVVRLSVILVIALLGCIATACSNDEPEGPVSLRTELIRVYDIEHRPDTLFKAVKSDGYYRCSYATYLVREEQTVTSIEANYEDGNLRINFKLDKDMFGEPFNRGVMIEFNLYDLPAGSYNLAFDVGGGSFGEDPRVWTFE